MPTLPNPVKKGVKASTKRAAKKKAGFSPRRGIAAKTSIRPLDDQAEDVALLRRARAANRGKKTYSTAQARELLGIV